MGQAKRKMEQAATEQQLSRENARDFILKLEKLILLHCNQPANLSNYADDIEMLRRELTDYLIATDPRRGIAVYGPNDH